MPGHPFQVWFHVTTGFIRDHVARAGAKGVVLGLSGGLDSAVVAKLAVAALGTERVLGVLLPSRTSNPEDRVHAQLLAKQLGIETVEVPIGDAADAIANTLEAAGWTMPDPQPALVNTHSRLRMVLLYAYAQARGALVLGTGNKSEMLTGYSTKYGDGGVDLQPIGDLYKSDLFEWAKELGIPKEIVEKPPSAGLRPGQTDEEDLGMTYDQLDQILRGFERNWSPGEIATKLNCPLEEVQRIDGLVRRSEHKRRTPIVPKVGLRTVGIDWRRSVHWDG